MRAIAALLMLFLLPAAALGPEHCRKAEILDADGRPLSGIEDLVFHPPSRTLILSAHDRWADAEAAADAPMGLFAVPAGDLMAAERALAHRIGPAPASGLARRPHGVALRDFGDGDWRLAVIDHRALQRERTPDGRAGTVIETFRVAADGSLTPGRVVEGALCPANDLDWIDRDRLIVTIDRDNCGGFRRFMELSLGLHEGRLIEVDLRGGPPQLLAEDLGFPNGVGVRGDEVFVAFSREERLARYVRDEAGSLTELDSLPTDGGGDNLSWDSKGRLLLAIHPSVWRFGLYSLRVPGFAAAPSRLVRIDPADDTVTTIYDDPEGELFSGATSVIEAGGHFIAGAAFDSGLLVCPADG